MPKTLKKRNSRTIKKSKILRLPKKELKLYYYLMSNQRCSLQDELSRHGFSSKILKSFFSVPRELFIPKRFRNQAYLDKSISIGFKQQTPKPSLICQMISLLELKPNNNVLEIGTGTGFTASIMSLLVHKVITIENIKSLVLEAKKKTDLLKNKKILKRNIELIYGDGEKGYITQGLFDKIILTFGKIKTLPIGLGDQLREGGILIAQLLEGDKEYIFKFVKRNNKLIKTRHGLVNISEHTKEQSKNKEYFGKRDLHELLLHFQIGNKKCNLYNSLKQQTKEDTLEAFMNVPREMFMPFQYIEKTYNDRPHPIGYDQTISQPSLVCKMIDFLNLKSTDRVLEVGTGYGYNAALISRIVQEVVTLDIVLELVEGAREVYNFLIKKGILSSNLLVLHGDGYKGYPEKKHYDKIIVTCGATGEVPGELLNQLSPNGGICVIPIKKRHKSGNEFLYRYIKNGDEVKEEELIAVRFVPFLEKKELKSKIIT